MNLLIHFKLKSIKHLVCMFRFRQGYIYITLLVVIVDVFIIFNFKILKIFEVANNRTL